MDDSEDDYEGLRIPPLRSSDRYDDPPVVGRFFTSDGVWYVLEGHEYGEDDYRYYGYVLTEKIRGFRYWTMSELERRLGPMGGEVQLDINFEPFPLSKVIGKRRR